VTASPRRIIGIVILIAGLVGGILALVLPAPADRVTLAAADNAGENPFLAGGTVTPAPAPAPGLPFPPAVARTGNTPARYPGTTPGLYGGTQRVSTCNSEQIIGYLETNPGPAAAWAKVPRIPPSAIRAFISGLTPVILRTDIRVTNFGLRDDEAVPAQVVLQSGTSVLVDPSGVPRVRCGSGNPLDNPRFGAGGGNPSYVGTPWPRFSPTTVIVVAPTRAIGSIIIVDLGRGGVIIRLPGDVGRDTVIAVLPSLLLPGDPVNVRGRVFPPGTPVTVRYDLPAEELGTTNADGAGNIAIRVSIPDDSGPGLHLVTAVGGGVSNVLPIYVLPPAT
jgi:hypothetical protein